MATTDKMTEDQEYKKKTHKLLNVCTELIDDLDQVIKTASSVQDVMIFIPLMLNINV